YSINECCCLCTLVLSFCFFFFNDTATTEIYTLSLHDALPICFKCGVWTTWNRPYGEMLTAPSFPLRSDSQGQNSEPVSDLSGKLDRKSTRLNSSHLVISYAVFCLKKKKRKNTPYTTTTPPQQQ